MDDEAREIDTQLFTKQAGCGGVGRDKEAWRGSQLSGDATAGT